MKYWTCLFLLTVISCSDQQQKVSSPGTLVSDTTTNYTGSRDHSNNQICWTGTLNARTPVFIHYQLDSNLIIGEIIYLNTKDKLPITLLGTIEEDKSYRLLEFDKTGNITGVIEGKPTENSFNGFWVSPKTKRELAMILYLKDTLIESVNTRPVPGDIFGDYHYQYGDKGYNGDLYIKKTGNNKVEFSILSLTNVERGPNIAEVERDSITMTGNSFIYKIPGSDSCEFKAIFYTGFVYVNYTKGYCESQFGLNATIDGIYLKTK